MSLFNLDIQNSSLDNKIVAGLERLSQVYRILLWEKSKLYNLSPIQIQLLIFICYHSSDKNTVGYLSREFNVTPPTISDALKSLGQKKMIRKVTNTSDTRSYSITLSAAGKKIVSETENFVNPITEIISTVSQNHKKILWENISSLIINLANSNVITIQRTCFSCKHYSLKHQSHFCNLLAMKLAKEDIRIDCKEFEIAE